MVTASAFTNKTAQTCTAGETGNVTFTAKIKNPRTKDASATTFIGTNETYKTTKVACANHPAYGHEKASTPYSTTAATCTTASTEKWRCVRYGQGGCNKSYDDTHNSNAIGHNYAKSDGTGNATITPTHYQCGTNKSTASYEFVCVACGQGKVSGTIKTTLGYDRQYPTCTLPQTMKGTFAQTINNPRTGKNVTASLYVSDKPCSEHPADGHSYKWTTVKSCTDTGTIKPKGTDSASKYKDAYITTRTAMINGYGITASGSFKDLKASDKSSALKKYNHNGESVGPLKSSNKDYYWPASDGSSACLWLIGKVDSNGGSHENVITLSSNRKYRLQEWCTVYRGVNNTGTDWTDQRWFGSVKIILQAYECSKCHDITASP